MNSTSSWAAERDFGKTLDSDFFLVTPVMYSFHFTEFNSVKRRMGHEI